MHAHPPGQPARRPRYGPQRPVIPPSGIPPSAVRRRDTVLPGPAPTATTGSSALATTGGATPGGTTPAGGLSADSEGAGDADRLGTSSAARREGQVGRVRGTPRGA